MSKEMANGDASASVPGCGNRPLTQPAHALTWEEVATELDANPTDGLSASEAQARMGRYGPNDIGAGSSTEPLEILIKQIANAMTLILIMATGVSFGIQAWIEGGVLAAVVVLNIVVGFIQEFQAGKTMDSLRTLSSPSATVYRDGQAHSVQTSDLVPGDLVEVLTGNTVPSDIRIIEAVNFETDEALLTGESLPVRKAANDIFHADTGPGDRLNIAYASSTVTKGRARGIVFGTGMHTEIGSIAAALRENRSGGLEVKRRADGSASPAAYVMALTYLVGNMIGNVLGTNIGTPLQRKLSRLAIFLFFTAVICAIIVLGANTFDDNKEVIIYAVATGLSMIPSSLVVVLTITMTVGTKRMVERQVIVRNLNSLEALGAVTNICSDKTGTLTQGKMVAKMMWIPSRGTYSIGESSEPYNPNAGGIFKQPDLVGEMGAESLTQNARVTPDELLIDNVELEEYLKVASLANLASVYQDTDAEWKARGDPTEIAIQVLACRFGWDRSLLTSGDVPSWRQVAEFPFDSDVKKMSVIFQETRGKNYVFTKGAVERIINSCTSVHVHAGKAAQVMTDDIKSNIIANMEAIASQGLRVLALASKEFTDPIDDMENINRSAVEKDLTFRGLIGLYDPPRPESAPSVRRCHQAGIAVHMLTGDHPGTATAIALSVGILPSRFNGLSKESSEKMVMTAHQFDKLADDEIDRLPTLPFVIARCAPSTKVRMIKALHRRKKFAAMTGDGVNDSPSLKDADVGIAMGQAGSDVAKDASDIVLTNDNFASILNAIEEGRRMFDNIQKFILHVLSQNLAQALVLLVGLAFKDEQGLSIFPLSPVEIVWLVMITSGLPDMGLGFEQATADILTRPPRSLKKGIFTLEMLFDMIVYGIWVAAICLGAFTLVLYGFNEGTETLGENCNNTLEGCEIAFRARATTFACLTWFVLFLAWEMVDMRRSFFNMRPVVETQQSSWRRWTQWTRDIWANQFLFWANIAGFLLVFPLIYIPVINDKVFRHTGITWEWAIVAVGTVLFFLGVEAWKWIKRAYFRRLEVASGGKRKDSKGDLERQDSHVLTNA